MESKSFFRSVMQLWETKVKPEKKLHRAKCAVKVKWSLDPRELGLGAISEVFEDKERKKFCIWVNMARLLVFVLCASMVTTQHNGNVVKDRGELGKSPFVIARTAITVFWPNLTFELTRHSINMMEPHRQHYTRPQHYRATDKFLVFVCRLFGPTDHSRIYC